MGDNRMAEYNPSMEEIGIFVKKNIREWVKPIILEFSHSREIDLAERFVRVEEELKSQRELMRQGFELSEKRFEDLHRQMDQRFLQVDKRFEGMQHSMDKRFEEMQNNMDKRFEQVDKRFESVQNSMNQRFMDVDKRFNVMQWFIGIGFTLIVVLMSIYQFVR